MYRSELALFLVMLILENVYKTVGSIMLCFCLILSGNFIAVNFHNMINGRWYNSITMVSSVHCLELVGRGHHAYVLLLLVLLLLACA